MCSKNLKISSCLSLSAVFLITSFHVVAGPVKSVDEKGHVTYSDKPVPGAASVSKIPIVDGPSAAEVEAAKQQADNNINAAKKIDKENKAALAKQQAEKKKIPVTTEQKQTETGINTPTGDYYGSNPNYNRPAHKPRPPINRPRPPGNKPPANRPPPVNLPARPGGR